ncbi:uncharacterized protein LOC122019916 isoform X1 [Zingiber officinale]|uniref:Uncharacterized protein n=1 Tax=Zingiber officinale TaxID=94328 RepID=A0A8J5F9D1_ZINOF|nr:uncharacterized protein LOC122019916 isoform X1 [Zingiber officinale]XP_042433475.1 uncharacterized protein LOC122019916 isoform X1 [Zingiber officinale]XP_042433478.1 uncharacterized protein LOC122019916 isoform X1 [Zingiber officinale]KAG6478744.1 hypothetical protein ZIOFF_062188 [Zingiber officinale]
MMAECTYQHKENNMGDETVRAPNVQYHSQWIKRWTREATKSVPRNHQCFAVSSSSKAEVHEKVKRLQVDTLESGKFKTLKSVMNQGSVSEYKKIYRFGFSKVALPVEVQQSAESSYRTSQISHVVQFASEEHQFEPQTNMKCLNQDMQPHIAVKGSLSCVDDIEGSTAQWQIGQCEKQRSSTRPFFSTLNLEGGRCPSSSRLEGSEVNRVNFSSSSLLLTWKDSVSLKRFDDLGHNSSCDLQMLKIPSSSSTMKNTREGQPRLSDAGKAFLMAKNTSVRLSPGKQINMDSSNSTKGQRIAVYEMLTVPKRPDGCSSEGLQKDLQVFELTKDQSRSTSPKEPSTSIYMETDTKLSHPVYKEIHAESCDPGVLLDSEACSRWLKRLQSKPVASPAIGSNKFKTGDGPPSGQTCYEIPISPKEKEAVNLKKRMTNSRFSSGISMENFCTWMQRWCCKNTLRNEAVVDGTPASCEAANSHLTKSHETMKQFPSLAAMALVGGVIKQFHTCVFRRVGSSVVWNIEPF